MGNFVSILDVINVNLQCIQGKGFMDNVRKPHQKINADFRLMFSVGLAGTMAIASSSGVSSLAQTRANPSLPKVQSDTTASTSTVASPTINSAPKNTTTASKSSSPSNATASARFFCQVWNGQYTVMYSPESRSGEVFPWAVPKDLGNGWVAEKRCNEISRRLEEYRPDGLNELSTSTENGLNIVCATTQSSPSCRIVFTVPPGQDPLTTRNSVFQNLTIADNGTMTQGVNTYVSNGNRNVNLTDNLVNLGLSILGSNSGLSGNSGWKSSYADRDINLKPFLSPADGGTGRALTNGVRLHRGLRLNPNNFR
jgi:Circadian oscillating protein COP23